MDKDPSRISPKLALHGCLSPQILTPKIPIHTIWYQSSKIWCDLAAVQLPVVPCPRDLVEQRCCVAVICGRRCVSCRTERRLRQAAWWPSTVVASGKLRGGAWWPSTVEAACVVCTAGELHTPRPSAVVHASARTKLSSLDLHLVCILIPPLLLFAC
jgi:hypothetical protein